MAFVQIRFNNKFQEANDPELKWRILVDGREHLARSVAIETPCFTTEDLLPTGELKYHLSCNGQVKWKGEHATIEEDRLHDRT